MGDRGFDACSCGEPAVLKRLLPTRERKLCAGEDCGGVERFPLCGKGHAAG